MNSKKQKIRLGDICDITSSKRIFAREYRTFGVPFYRGKEIIEKQMGKNVSTELYIDESRYNEITERFGTPQKGDILLTSVGTLGIPYVVGEERFYFKDGNLTWMRNFTGADSRFIYYWFLSPFGKIQIDQKSIGSTQKALTIETLLKFEIDLPDLPTQRIIANTLFTIDKKIVINTKINRHLGQVAQTIFKSWFVDFEPFDGVMPDDWNEGTFNDLISTTLGGDWGKDLSVGNNTQEIYCIRGTDIPDVNNGNKGKLPIRYILPKNYASKKLAAGDIVVEISVGSPTQSTGRCVMISQSLLDRYDRSMVCTNFCRVIKPLVGYSVFVYFYWKYLYNQNVMFSYENGTTGIKNFDITGFLENEPIIIPPLKIVSQFNEVIGVFIDKIFANGQENEDLANIRNTLLPRLMTDEMIKNQI
ncbi:MAG: restriction endonuclease subunit S [Defluviitaleaceae bacterium]|nr:restriction endonuclease subunit S [Defluviitaleaceae bacterium]